MIIATDGSEFISNTTGENYGTIEIRGGDVAIRFEQSLNHSVGLIRVASGNLYVTYLKAFADIEIGANSDLVCQKVCLITGTATILGGHISVIQGASFTTFGVVEADLTVAGTVILARSHIVELKSLTVVHDLGVVEITGSSVATIQELYHTSGNINCVGQLQVESLTWTGGDIRATELVILLQSAISRKSICIHLIHKFSYCFKF